MLSSPSVMYFVLFLRERTTDFFNAGWVVRLEVEISPGVRRFPVYVNTYVVPDAMRSHVHNG